ncbi:MAG TPA: ATP-dependent DNA helicase, partial [Chitinophagaceae bacterium]|nr:ATP-dependent DNA helicase [Chitinophagaceae bacterium]
NESLLLQYQEQFQYVLVDEYQDTSGSQNKIVRLLIDFWEKPNVFVVGDDDQSIYRFQGANIENMLAFADGYKKDLLTVVLTNNYRSTQPILNVSKTLIDKNNERLVAKLEDLSKDLLSSHDGVKHLTHLPQVKEYVTQRDEMIGIVTEVEKLITEGVAGNSIGIIYRENRYGDELAEYFRLKGLPFYTKRNLNILDQPIIQQLILVLNYLAAEHDTPYGGDEMLFEILHFEWFDIAPIEIAKASVQVADQNYKGNRTSLRQWICERAGKPVDLFDQGIPKSLCEAVTIMENLIRAVSNNTLQSLLEKVIREGGFLSHIINHQNKNWLLQLITGFYNHVKEETHRHPLTTLDEFMNRIALMRKEGLVLPLVQVAGNEKGVNLMTVHGSKGLEFDYVFFVSCNANCWENKRKPYSGFTFPDTLFISSAKQNDTEELRRLFYVAITRAKKYLSLSYSHYNNEGKELEPSGFLAEIFEEHELPREKVLIDAASIADYSALQLTGKIAPDVAHLDDELTDRLVNGFVMNVSALNNYLHCPLEFYFRNIVRIPSPKNEAMEFGSAVHHALEELYLKMQKNKNTFPPVEEFVTDFVWFMRRHRESFTKEQFARRLEYGTEILRNYYKAHIHTSNKIVSIERYIKNVPVDDILLKGKIDKIEFNGKEALIVDYKTGDPEKRKEKLARPNPKIPDGGDYWRQAVFYKLMLDNYHAKEWEITGFEFDFVEPDKKKTYHKERVLINEEDIKAVKEQIKSTYHKIQNKDFYTGCGKEECHWCNFVKTNKLAVALHEIHDEEEEVRSSISFLRVVE